MESRVEPFILGVLVASTFWCFLGWCWVKHVEEQRKQAKDNKPDDPADWWKKGV